MTRQSVQQPVRSSRETVFRKLFSEKKTIIELYNAIGNTHYGLNTNMEFIDLENVIYTDVKKDLGFVIDKKYVIIAEYQPTICFNLPLRNLIYLSPTLEHIMTKFNIYAQQRLKMPSPEFYIIFTGSREWPEEILMLPNNIKNGLSIDSQNLSVKVIKIGYTGAKEEILNKSPTLLGYNMLLTYIKSYRAETGDLKAAIGKSVRRCIKEGYIADFLRKYGSEVMSMLFEEITAKDLDIIRNEKERVEEFSEAIDRGERLGIEKSKSVLTLFGNGLSPAEISKKTGYDSALINKILK